jgi:hypothetical protein
MAQNGETQNFLFMAGQSKAERMFQDKFVLTDKESGFKIIKEHGVNAFTMWWILQSYCYGKGKAHAFPSLKTLSKLVKKSERTVQRWLDDLAKAKGIKIVPCYWADTGSRTSNLYVLNHEFPDVPEWWDHCFQHGAIRTRDNQFYERPEPSKIAHDKSVGGITKPMTNLSGALNQGFSEDTPEEPNKIAHDKNVGGITKHTTKMSGALNQGSEAEIAKNPESMHTTKMSGHEEEKDISIQEEQLDIKKNNNKHTYEENERDTYTGPDEEKSVVVVESHKSEIRSQFEEKIGLQLTDSLLDELIEITKDHLAANQEEVTSASIVARLTDYIHKVDKYNRPFKTNGYVVLKTAIQNHYQYIDAEQETAPSVQPRGKKYEMLRNRQSEEKSITEEEERIRNKRIELRKQQLKVNDQIHLLQNKDFLSQEQEAQLAALKEEMEKLKQELALLDKELEQLAM